MSLLFFILIPPYSSKNFNEQSEPLAHETIAIIQLNSITMVLKSILLKNVLDCPFVFSMDIIIDGMENITARCPPNL